MSYQVLARKWRPRSFNEMVGQEHVLKALVNALDHKRLHHAYLFTGTRGVGKTTVARILAKCLNCETGVGSSPCGVCTACVEINEGRFVDLIEVDAASRTKVEDTRELLDNVQYSPTNGRFKIYLIDEVHMLSNSSFNALLKTLEEPPEHVKFLLATTDPQKLPATILSRCLQFNLKNMSPEKIVAHLENILKEEMVPYQESALWQLARGADGSMRDALSLTDQAIAFGNGKLDEADVSAMLGTIDNKFIQNIVEALIHQDGAKLLNAVAAFSEHAPDYAAALADLQTLLHRIAIAQALPEALDNSYGDRQQILKFATQLTPEDVQLFYQTALVGQRDLSYSPIPRTGFEMVLLRMLAFKPQALVDVPKTALPPVQNPDEKHELTNTAQETAAADVHTPEPSSLESPQVETPQVEASPPEASRQYVEDDKGAPETVKKPEAVRAVAPETKPRSSDSEAESEAGIQDPSLRPPWVEAPREPAQPEASQEIAELSRSDVASKEAQGQSHTHASSASSAPSATECVKSRDKPSREALLAEIAHIENKPENKPNVAIPQERRKREQERAPERSVSEDACAPPEATGEGYAVSKPQKEKFSLASFTPERWIDLFFQLPISGVVKMTASNLICAGCDQHQFMFVQDENAGGLLNSEHAQYLGDALSDYFETPCRAVISVAATDGSAETPAQFKARRRHERRAAAIEDLRVDPHITAMAEHFGATLDEDSVNVPEEQY